ncbi:MAG TPA: TnsA-like heteromeric transposase endonuclease subunit, partial [Streptosporangiaceae bacterium]
DVLVSAPMVAADPAALAAVVEVGFAGADGARRRERLASCWDVRFEDVAPVRPFRWVAGQRHFSGWWWSATTGRHVGHESWLERDQAMMLDFDRRVVAFSSQPFWLSWTEETKVRRHAPDYFARLADGTAMVIDVRADDQIPAKDAEVFEMTARACASVGWDYRRAGVVDPVLAANVRWLAGYRHPRCMDQGKAACGVPQVCLACELQ